MNLKNQKSLAMQKFKTMSFFLILLIFLSASVYSDGLPDSSLATENTHIIPRQYHSLTLPPQHLCFPRSSAKEAENEFPSLMLGA